MSAPVRSTGPTFWINYFRRVRAGRSPWWSRWRHPRCALCGERVATHAFSAHVMDRHLDSGPPRQVDP